MRKAKCREISLLLLGLLLTLVTGCGTLENGRGWGQDALYPVNSRRVSKALYNSLTDLGTLIPAGAAAVSSLDTFDERVNSWAIKRTPILGSIDSASRASNYLLGVLQAEVVLTALATPSGEDSKEWFYSKAKGLSVELGAELVTAGVTRGLKSISDRERPCCEDSGFPSSHSSGAFTNAVLANRNLQHISMSDNLRLALEVGNFVLASATAWARVEANEHWLSDVLAGAAAGYFLGSFVHDAFMGLPGEKPVQVKAVPLQGGAILLFSFPF